jgi:hypothetical protein
MGKAPTRGRTVWRPVISVRRTSGSAFSSWPTPTVYNASRTPEQHEAKSKELVESGTRALGLPLSVAAQLAPWPTPGANEKGMSPEEWERPNAKQKAANPKLGTKHKMLSTVAPLAAWPTPIASRYSQLTVG